MTDLRALAEALADARTAEARAEQDLDEVHSDPEFRAAFDAERIAAGAVHAAVGDKLAVEANLRAAIGEHYAETGEGPDIEGLGIQWRSEPAYDDEDASDWISNAALRADPADTALAAWLLDCIVKHRPALNRIILEYRPPFADWRNKRLVPTISGTLNDKLIEQREREKRAADKAQAMNEHYAFIEEHTQTPVSERTKALVEREWGTREDLP